MTAAELLGALLALDADTLRKTEVMTVCSEEGGFSALARSVYYDATTLFVSDEDRADPGCTLVIPDDGQCAERQRRAADALKALVDAAKNVLPIVRELDVEELSDAGHALRAAIAKVEGGS